MGLDKRRCEEGTSSSYVYQSAPLSIRRPEVDPLPEYDRKLVPVGRDD